MFYRAFVYLSEEKYRNLDKQSTYDELSSHIKSGKKFTINNNQIYTVDLQIVRVQVQSFTIATITTHLPHNLQSGDNINISNIPQVSGVNGDFPVLTTPTPNTFTIQSTFTGIGIFQVNGLLTGEKFISDYVHLLAVKVRIKNEIETGRLRIASAENGIIRFNKISNLQTGQLVDISGVTGAIGINGVHYLKSLGSFKRFKLFQDEYLQVPSLQQSELISGVSTRVAKIQEKYARQLVSDQKVSVFNKKISDPEYEIAEKLIKFHPRNVPIMEITMDYITKGGILPNKVIDVNDDITDLTLYYTEKFLVDLLDVAQKIFIKDQEQDAQKYQIQQMEIVNQQ